MIGLGYEMVLQCEPTPALACQIFTFVCLNEQQSRRNGVDSMQAQMLPPHIDIVYVVPRGPTLSIDFRVDIIFVCE